MVQSANLYASATAQAWAGNIKWGGSDVFKYMLLSSSDVAHLGTHVHYSDVSGIEVTGTGYTATGATITASAPTLTTASSWAVSWPAATTPAVGTIIKATVSSVVYLYTASVVTGPTAPVTAPTFPSAYGATVLDNGNVTWTCIGESIVTFSATSPSWPSSTINAAAGVIYDSTSLLLIAHNDYGGTISSSAATFTAPEPAAGWWFWVSA